MDDLISRKEAIDWIKGWFDTDKHYHPYSKGKTIPTCEVMDILERVPSAEPERLTDEDFETIRIHLNAYKEQLGNQYRFEEAEEYQRIIDRFMSFASAEPERKKEVVTPNEFETSMKKIAIEHDPETFHEYADDLMCAVLNGLGYEDGVKIFQDTEKWYS